MLLACCRVLMNVTQVHPLDTVEFAPSLPPLSEAMTEEQHNEVLQEEQAKVRVRRGKSAQRRGNRGGR